MEYTIKGQGKVAQCEISANKVKTWRATVTVNGVTLPEGETVDIPKGALVILDDVLASFHEQNQLGRVHLKGTALII